MKSQAAWVEEARVTEAKRAFGTQSKPSRLAERTFVSVAPHAVVLECPDTSGVRFKIMQTLAEILHDKQDG